MNLAYLMDPAAAQQTGFMQLLAGLSVAVRDSGYHLLVLPEPAERDSLDIVRYMLQRRLADGAVLTHTTPQDERLEFLQERSFPFIAHGRTALPTPHASVDFDNAAFAEKAVDCLVGRQRRRLALILPRANASYRDHLREGFTRACLRNRVAGDSVEAIDLDSSPAEINDWARPSLSAYDGLVLAGESPLLPLLGALSDLGRHPGHDLDIVLKYSSKVPCSLRIPLFVCHENLHQAGLSLGLSLLQMLAHPEAPPPQMLFSPPTIETLHHANA